MYFASRLQAGRMLAAQLKHKYRSRPCAVIALSEGGVIVGAQIAASLHGTLGLIASDEIDLPREPVAIGGISQDGSFSYNHSYSKGEIDELVGEYYSFIEQEKLGKLRELHRTVGNRNLIRPEFLRGRNIILTSDGFSSPFPLDLALEYLKPIKMERLIVAVPLATVPTVDRLHIIADDIYCLSVIEDYISTDHYYDNPDVPNHEALVRTIENISLDWG